MTSPTLPWAKPRPNHVFQTPPVFLPTVSALMVQVSRPHLNQRTATCDAKFDRRRRSAGCAAPGVCCSAARGWGRGLWRISPRPLCRRDPSWAADAEKGTVAPGRRAVQRRHHRGRCHYFQSNAICVALGSTCCCSSQSRSSRAAFQTSEGHAVEFPVLPAGWLNAPASVGFLPCPVPMWGHGGHTVS